MKAIQADAIAGTTVSLGGKQTTWAFNFWHGALLR